MPVSSMAGRVRETARRDQRHVLGNTPVRAHITRPALRIEVTVAYQRGSLLQDRRRIWLAGVRIERLLCCERGEVVRRKRAVGDLHAVRVLPFIRLEVLSG
jgi:hypothetical protein